MISTIEISKCYSCTNALSHIFDETVSASNGLAFNIWIFFDLSRVFNKECVSRLKGKSAPRGFKKILIQTVSQ